MSKKDVILTLNAGSSSLKFGLFDASATKRHEPDQLYRGAITDLDSTPHMAVFAAGDTVIHDSKVVLSGHEQTVSFLLDWLDAELPGINVIAVGHRIVHGGPDYASPVLINPTVIGDLQSLIPLAPLHLPHNLAAIHAVQQRSPTTPQVACFDTAFHRSMAWNEQTYALPREWFDRGVMRYGFHGLSYEYIASALAEMPEIDENSRVVVAHLGHGASLCAMRGGKSVATTMGFTPLDGLPMATRPGSLDPGVILWLINEMMMSSHDVEKLLNQQSGLLGLSGISGDVEQLLESPQTAAAEAIDYFTHHTQRAIASMAATLGGIDALVFTGGIGENAPAIRESICRQADWLGIELNCSANLANKTRISKADSRVTVLRIPTSEEKVIARHTQTLGLKPAAAPESGRVAAPRIG